MISILFVAPKAKAEEVIRSFLAGRGLFSEDEVNGGAGRKFSCSSKGIGFSVLLYFRKTGLSSRIVCESVPERLVDELKEAVALCLASGGLSSRSSRKAVRFGGGDLLAGLRPQAQVAALPSLAAASGSLSSAALDAASQSRAGEASTDEVAQPEISKDEVSKAGFRQIDAPEAWGAEGELLRGALAEAVRRFSRDVYDFLFPADQRALSSALAVLELVKRAGLGLSSYNGLFQPFSSVFQGFLAKLMAERGIKDLESFGELENHGASLCPGQLGATVRSGSSRGSDRSLHGAVVDRLKSAWSGFRRLELLSDPQGELAFELETLSELENRLGEMASVMIDSWRIFIRGVGPGGPPLEAMGPAGLKPAPKTEISSKVGAASKPLLPMPLPGSAASFEASPSPRPGPAPAVSGGSKQSPSKQSPSKRSQAKPSQAKQSQAKQSPAKQSDSKRSDSKMSPYMPAVVAKVRLGTDESGKGDYFGPLVVAGVYCDEALEEALLKLGVRDSKRSSDYANMAMAKKIRAVLGADRYEISVLSPPGYNSLYKIYNNINKILAASHAEVIDKLLARVDCGFAVVDQFADESLVENALAALGREVKLLQMPRAERDPVVAAASILARAAFLEELSLEGKALGAELPKGSGKPTDTAGRRLLKELGPEKLMEVVKLHFKNSKKIGLLPPGP